MNHGRRLGPILFASSLVLFACGPEPSGSPLSIDLLTESQPAQACMDALATGRLVPDPRSGLGITASDGSQHSVMWPFGYSAVYSNDALWLLDAGGTSIATEGDRIQMGGGFGRDLFYACANSIRRVE